MSQILNFQKVKAIRADFPILQNFPETGSETNSKSIENSTLKLIYLDNAATTQTPQVVVDEMTSYYTTYKANIGRGSGQIASLASDKVENSRVKVHHFLKTDPKIGQVIFTSGSTDSFNLLALSLYKYFKKQELNESSEELIHIDDNFQNSHKNNNSSQNGPNEHPKFQTSYEVIVPQLEHHSNFLVWPEYFATRVWTLESAKDLSLQTLNKSSQEIHLDKPAGKDNLKTDTANSFNQKNLDFKHELELTLHSLKKLITPQTRVLAISHCSNLTGQILPLKEIIAKVRSLCPGICVVVDGSQAAAHLDLNLPELDCDFYIFSAHKMFGPSGCGVLWGRNEWLNRLEPPKFGGGMVQTVHWSNNFKTETESVSSQDQSDNLDIPKPKNQKLEKTSILKILTNSTTESNLNQQSTLISESTNSIWANLPHSWEAGSSNIAGIIGLGAAIDYLEAIRQKYDLDNTEKVLWQYCYTQLEQIPGINLIAPVSFTDFTINSDKNLAFDPALESGPNKTGGDKNYRTDLNNLPPNLKNGYKNQSPIITFYHWKIASFDLAEILSLSGICLRSGSFCCQPLAQFLPVQSLLRVSLSFYNTKSEIDFFINRLKLAIKMLL